MPHPDRPCAPRTISAVCFYISGHGFGHASRQIEIINALGPHLPAETRILIRTAADPWLFERTVRVPYTYLPGACDTGIVQVDSLRLDEPATARRAADFYSTFDARAADEALLLRARGVRLVIADAPPLGCAAAALAGIPSIVVGNFTWDWIYEGYGDLFPERAPGVLQAIRDAYACATAGWRLPMHGGFATIQPIVDLPFVARHARHGRDEVRERLRLPPEGRLALSSFGGYGVQDFDPAALDCLDAWTVVITGRTPPNTPPPAGVAFVAESRLYDSGIRYEDLVAAVDVVVTKPGYGIVSECVANGTAVLYTSRGRFVEYDVMTREMPNVLRCRYLDQEAFLAGRWGAALDALLDSPPAPAAPPTNGAEIAATRLLQYAL